MSRESGTKSRKRFAVHAAAPLILVAALLVCLPSTLRADKEPHWTPQQAPIAKNISNLRSLADDVRPRATQLLATQIRALPASENKVTLAYELANLCTEGDQGQDTVQAAATTLAEALRQNPVPDQDGKPADQYVELASLVHYEDAHVFLDSPPFRQAMNKLQLDDVRREHINFTLTDLNGKRWTLRDLRGQVVLVNFWATWCPPCRKEMPDLNALYKELKPKGFVVLAISDEQPEVVRSFLAKHKVSYPVLIDPGDKVHKEFDVIGIPKSYLYNRDGRLVSQAMDMRTRQQFLGMLAKANLKPENKLGKQLKHMSPAKVIHGN